MTPLEEQFPPINPLVLQRPDALDPPDREDEESNRTANRSENETPIPNTLASGGVDRVTLSANARAINPVQPNGETVPVPRDNIQDNRLNPAVPESLNQEAQRRAVGNPEASAGEASQPPAFPELDPNQPFVPNSEPAGREEADPAGVQAPLNVPPPAVEDAEFVMPPLPDSVEALNENPAALRGNNLGTEPALRGNRELRNFLQESNAQIEPPEEVVRPEGAPIPEFQNNAPPSPAGFENLEAVRPEPLNEPRAPEATGGVTRPEEERTAPPAPHTPESLLTERGQNIDRFV